jgi:hypothetical protein
MFGAPELFSLMLLNCLHYFNWTVRSHAPQSHFLNCLISMPELPRITVLNYRLSALKLPVHYLNCHVSAPELPAHLPHKYNLNICAPTNLPPKRTLNYWCITRTSTWANMNCWYVSNVSIIFDAPCLFFHYLPCISLHSMAFLCDFWN